MKICLCGSQPNLILYVYSSSLKELREKVNQLKDVINFYGSASINDMYDICGLPNPSSAYDHIGWNYHDIQKSFMPIMRCCGCDNSGVYEEYCFSLPTTRENQDLKFKPALPKSAKDAKIQKAYNVLSREYFRKEGTDEDLVYAVEEALGYLAEVLE